jgi:hypothetical protein
MHVFGSIAYAMVSNKKRCKFNAKGIKRVFLGYCEDMKAFRLMCLEINKGIKIKDSVFMEDSGSIRNNLEMHPSVANEGPTLVVVDEYFKLMFIDGGGQFVDGNKQVRDNKVEIEEGREGTATRIH